MRQRKTAKNYFMKSLIIKFLFVFSLICAFSFVSSAQISESESNYLSDRKLKILEKPVPKLTEEQREENICVQGQVILKVEFLANSEIGNVTIIKTLPYGLAENAVEAAKKIKFQPETKNGIATSVFKLVQYTFSWDGGWRNVPISNVESKNDEEKNDSQKSENKD